MTDQESAEPNHHTNLRLHRKYWADLRNSLCEIKALHSTCHRWRESKPCPCESILHFSPRFLGTWAAEPREVFEHWSLWKCVKFESRSGTVRVHRPPFRVFWSDVLVCGRCVPLVATFLYIVGSTRCMRTSCSSLRTHPQHPPKVWRSLPIFSCEPSPKRVRCACPGGLPDGLVSRGPLVFDKLLLGSIGLPHAVHDAVAVPQQQRISQHMLQPRPPAHQMLMLPRVSLQHSATERDSGGTGQTRTFGLDSINLQLRRRLPDPTQLIYNSDSDFRPRQNYIMTCSSSKGKVEEQHAQNNTDFFEEDRLLTWSTSISEPLVVMKVLLTSQIHLPSLDIGATAGTTPKLDWKNKDEAGAQEVEGRRTTSSSVNTGRRRVSALIEHKRQDDLDVLHPALVVEVAAAVAATCWQGSDCRNNARKVKNILNTNLKNILVHNFHIRMKRQVLSCSITAATWARSRTTTMKRAWWHLQQQKWAKICRSKMLKSRDSSKSAKKRVFITKIKNDEGECITSRKGIADVLGEF